MRIDVDSLIADCRSALAMNDSTGSVHDVVSRAVGGGRALAATLGEPARGGIQILHRSPELTVLNVVWSPCMRMMPHDHRMWAVIGIYRGREDNDFWRRVPGQARFRIEHVNTRTLDSGDSVILDADVVHSVTNPDSAFTGAIHVYGGDFFATPRSAWDPESLTEQPFDGESARRLLEGATPAQPAAKLDTT